MNFDTLLELVGKYWPYVAVAMLAGGLTQAIKKSFKNFFLLNHIGMRITPFIPVVLGIIGGFLLPLETIREMILVGGALGTVSLLIYAAATNSLAKTAKLQEKVEKRKAEWGLTDPDPDPEEPEDTKEDE